MQAGKDGRLNGCIACPGAGTNVDDDDYGTCATLVAILVAIGGYFEEKVQICLLDMNYDCFRFYVALFTWLYTT